MNGIENVDNKHEVAYTRNIHNYNTGKYSFQLLIMERGEEKRHSLQCPEAEQFEMYTKQLKPSRAAIILYVELNNKDIKG